MNINNLMEPIQEPCQPPDLPETDNLHLSLSSFSLTVLQLNAHRSEAVLQNVLHAQQHHVLLIQEPWINKHTLMSANHPAWHLVMPMGHTPMSLDDRAKTCIYINKVIPTKAFASIPTESALLTAIDLDDPTAGLRVRIISWYNPPSDFCGLPVLKRCVSP